MIYTLEYLIKEYKDKLTDFLESTEVKKLLESESFKELYSIWIDRYCSYDYGYSIVLTALLLASGINPLYNQDSVLISQFSNLDIKEIEIPENIESISNSAFQLSGLESVKLNEGLLRIGENAFSGCSLKSIEIPASVQSIGMHAFYSCPVDSIVFNKSLNDMAICCDSLDVRGTTDSILTYLGLSKRANEIKVYIKNI